MPKPGRPPGAYTQYRRLRQLRDMLETHPKGLPIGEIAARLKVTERSVRRYLHELGREIDVDRASNVGGVDGVQVKIPARDLPRRVKLHRTQIYGLLMARRVFRMLEGTAFEQTLRDAVDQLLSHVQRTPRRGATVDPDTRLEDRFLYLPANPMRSLAETPDLAEVVDTVIDACAQLRECAIRYRKAGKSKSATEALTVHPYAVVLYRDAIYCVCFVKERSAVRTLRLDRIVDAEASPVRHFALPADFSVDKHFEGQFGLHTGETPVDVVIDFDAAAAEYVRGRRYPAEGGADGTIDELEGGGVRLRMRVGSTPELRAWVLSFGEQARVVEPVALADVVTVALRGALAGYAGTSEPSRKRGHGTTPRS